MKTSPPLSLGDNLEMAHFVGVLPMLELQVILMHALLLTDHGPIMDAASPHPTPLSGEALIRVRLVGDLPRLIWP